MAELYVLRLQPRGAFHFGTQGVGLEATSERCPSDTLYAALLMEAKRSEIAFPEPDLDGQLADPPIRLSSCFPYAGETLLFPLPRIKQEARADLQPGQRKQSKKLRYISLSLLVQMLAGKGLDTLPTQTYQHGAVRMATADEAPSVNDALWQESRIEHAAVDRIRSASQYYAVGQVRFAPGCGLFLLARVRDTAMLELLVELLARLGHSGLGGKRSAGLGQFDVAAPTKLDLPDEQGCERALLLSRYVPQQAELADEVLGSGAAYDLVQVGGWLHSDDRRVPSLQRKSIHMLTEGSVVQCMAERRITGQVVDVRPDMMHSLNHDQPTHRVLRYGIALTIGIGRKEAV